jgi:hypothetical protein
VSDGAQMASLLFEPFDERISSVIVTFFPRGVSGD